MSRTIIVNCGPYETRAAILEDGKAYELFFEIPDSEKIVGCIFKGRVAVINPGTQSAFVDIGQEKDAFLTLTGVEGAMGVDEDLLKEVFKSSIQDMLKVGQEVVLQVLKEPIAAKGPRSSMLISLPGRSVVLMPTADQIGISRRIASDKERERLRNIGKKLLPKGMGMIFRTAAEGLEERELAADLKILLKMWEQIEAKVKSSPPKTLIHRDLSLPLKLVRDYFTDEVTQFLIDSPEEYRNILDFCDFLSPLQRASFELYQEPVPIFEKFGVEDEIQRSLLHRFPLESGGYLIFDQTEAMVTIDINSGRFSSGLGLEETVFRVNLEAVKVIAQQVRLRNLAGMIIIDFIDMTEAKHRNAVVKALREAFRGDRNRPNIVEMSDLGLVQMTRRRTSHSLEEILRSPCPCCQGLGKVFAVSTLGNRIRTQVLLTAKQFEVQEIKVSAHPRVLAFFREDHGRRLKELEKRVERVIRLEDHPGLDVESFKIEPELVQDAGARSKSEHGRGSERHGRDEHRHGRDEHRRRRDGGGHGRSPAPAPAPMPIPTATPAGEAVPMPASVPDTEERADGSGNRPAMPVPGGSEGEPSRRGRGDRGDRGRRSGRGRGESRQDRGERSRGRARPGESPALPSAIPPAESAQPTLPFTEQPSQQEPAESPATPATKAPAADPTGAPGAPEPSDKE